MLFNRLEDWLKYLNMDYQGNYHKNQRQIRVYYEWLKSSKIKDDHPLSLNFTVQINSESLRSP